jgi:hypothetical protein
VPVGHELAVAGQAFQRLPLPDGVVALDVVEDARLQDEEGAVDPALAELWLLGEAAYLIALQVEAAEPGGRTAVTVARRPWPRWNASSLSRSMLATPPPQVIMNGWSPRYGARRLMRPPVAVSRPVSTSSMVQSSCSAPAWRMICRPSS